MEAHPASEGVSVENAKELIDLRAEETALRVKLGAMDMDDEDYWDLSSKIGDVVDRQKMLVGIYDNAFGIDGVYGEAFKDFEAANDDMEHSGHFALLAVRDELVELGVQYMAGLRSDDDLKKWYEDRSEKVGALRQKVSQLTTEDFVTAMRVRGLSPA